MAKAKKKAPGRPPGAANKKNSAVRDERAPGFRCTQGFNKTVEMLIGSGQYKSQADVYHEAVQQLAYKKTVPKEPNYNFWISKIQ